MVAALSRAASVDGGDVAFSSLDVSVDAPYVASASRAGFVDGTNVAAAAAAQALSMVGAGIAIPSSAGSVDAAASLVPLVDVTNAAPTALAADPRNGGRHVAVPVPLLDEINKIG